MIAEGLLWYDDDPRRPFSAKVAEAAQRFSERTGWAPTVCEANPQTLAQRGAAVVGPRGGRGGRSKTAPVEELDAPHLRVVPNPSLRPNYLLVGVEVGKTPRPARKARPTRIERAERVAPATSAAPRPRRALRARPAATEAPRASA